MEAATAPETKPETNTKPEQEAVTPVETSAAEEQAPQQLFRFASFVHVGPGADVCEEGEDGSCANPLHFHAWCRLPNQFQHASIRDKALAAKARRVRQMRHEGSDLYDILEAELDDMLRAGDKDGLIEEIVGRKFWEHHVAAMREVKEREEYTHVEDDAQRFQVLEGSDEEDRPADEYAELEAHLTKFEAEVTQARNEQEKPLRDALNQKDITDLVSMVRDDRIDVEANEEFMRVYSLWEWYIGTMKPRSPEKGTPVDRVFGDINHLQQAAPEVIEALERVFADLETAKGGLGNS